MIAKLPPSVQMLLFLSVGFILGVLSGYIYAVEKLKAKAAENELEVIIGDQKASKKIDEETNIVLKEIRTENAKDKPFECSDAKLPDDRVQRLQREIDRAGRRSDSSMLIRAIEAARNI